MVILGVFISILLIVSVDALVYALIAQKHIATLVGNGTTPSPPPPSPNSSTFANITVTGSIILPNDPSPGVLWVGTDGVVQDTPLGVGQFPYSADGVWGSRPPISPM